MASARADDGDLSTPDPSVLCKRIIPEAKQNAGTKNVVHAVSCFDDFASKFANDLDNNSEAYARGLVSILQAIMLSDALMRPSPELAERISAGVTSPDASGQPDPYFVSLMRWLSFKHSTGLDASFFSGHKRPTPKQLLQQVAFGALAGCDDRGCFGVSRMMVIDLLEGAFGSISSKADERVYAPTLGALDMDLIMVQYCVMLVLCRLYREEFEKDHVAGLKFLFRHSEAARIMALICPNLHQGHAEVAWNDLTKMLHGIQYVTPEAWDGARDSAKRAVGLAAKAQKDFALASSIYTLAFLLSVGPEDETFDLGEVKRLLFDLDQIEQRLDAWGMRDVLHAQCSTRKYLMMVKGTWDKPPATPATCGNKESAAGGKASGASKSKPPKSSWPITDWRVFDQRNQGFYTWLEPPNQAADVHCAGCNIPLIRVHRCDACKSAPFCSSICATANIEKHAEGCSPAPQPWLPEPTTRPPAAMPELGEEGWLGFVPWWVVKYSFFALLSYLIYMVLDRLDHVRHENRLTSFYETLQFLAMRLLKSVAVLRPNAASDVSAELANGEPSMLTADLCGPDGSVCPSEEFEV